MYGQMYYQEKLKLLVDKAHNAALIEYKRGLPKENAGKDDKEPKRVSSWGAVAMEQYAQETEEVKQKVQDAVRRQGMSNDALNEPLLQSENDDNRIEKLNT